MKLPFLYKKASNFNRSKITFYKITNCNTGLQRKFLWKAQTINITTTLKNTFSLSRNIQ